MPSVIVLSSNPARACARGTLLEAMGMLVLLLVLAGESRADILYVANNGNNTISKIRSDGTGSLFASGFGISQSGGAMGGLAFDTAGNLYATDEHDPTPTIDRLDRNGASTVFANTYLNAPHGAAFDLAGNLYVANGFGGYLVKFAPDGTGSVFGSGLSSGDGLALDGAGNFYVANFGNNTILKFTSNGNASVFASTGLKNPAGLAFDAAGNLYVSNYGNSTIERFTSSGVGSVFASVGLNGPIGLAFDSTGTLFVANANNSRIEKISATGTDLGAFATSAQGVSGPEFLAFTTDAGTPLPLPSQAISIPEPSVLAMLGVAALPLLARRRTGAGRIA